MFDFLFADWMPLSVTGFTICLATVRQSRVSRALDFPTKEEGAQIALSVFSLWLAGYVVAVLWGARPLDEIIRGRPIVAFAAVWYSLDHLHKLRRLLLPRAGELPPPPPPNR